MRLPRLALVLLLVLFPDAVSAAVVRVDVRRRDDAGTHERVIARVHFAVDPKRPANRAIADIDAAPVNTDGLVEFSGDLLMFVAKATSRSRGTVFVEVVNRGRDQSLALMSDASQGGPAPEAWDLGDRFLLEQGFTVAFLGWQFDVPPSQGLTFSAPLARVDGVVRETAIVPSRIEGGLAFRLAYCAAPAMRQAAALTYRVRQIGRAHV